MRMENKFNHWLYFIPRKDVLPRKAEWIQQSVVSFDPDNCKLMTSEGDEISYEFLVVAMGLQLNYKQVFFAYIIYADGLRLFQGL
jgi:NADH dehydrogenase FAD-containing subunit